MPDIQGQDHQRFEHDFQQIADCRNRNVADLVELQPPVKIKVPEWLHEEKECKAPENEEDCSYQYDPLVVVPEKAKRIVGSSVGEMQLEKVIFQNDVKVGPLASFYSRLA